MNFNENLNKIFHINCYDESRGKYWEIFAVNHEHFRLKILKYGVIINPILEYNHRLRVYKEIYEMKETNVNNYFYYTYNKSLLLIQELFFLSSPNHLT